MKKRYFVSILFTILLILIANVSLASYSTVQMSVVDEPVCTINITENSKFEKRLISKDLSNKEVTIQLQVTNNEPLNKLSGEVIIVLDNSASMEDSVGDTTRKELIFNSAKTLITNLLKDNNNLKIGIVSFSTNTDIAKEGTIEDAYLVSSLKDDSNDLTTLIDTINANGPRTNLDAGLTLASQQFSEEDNNKYMIILTDGVPNVAVDYDNTYYSDDVISKTKNSLLKLKSDGVTVKTLLTGIADESYVPVGTKSFGTIISEIFGTTSNPTVGDFYYITDENIENSVKDEIYNSLLPTSQSLKDIVIVDYFPQEIIDNFDFAYVSNTNIGEISSQIDKTTNSITWSIPELEYGETAKVQYKLKLKENFSSNIVNKILNTNQKVDISHDGKVKTSDVSPKLKLVEPPAILPKAGTTILIISVTISLFLLVFSIIKMTILHNNIN